MPLSLDDSLNDACPFSGKPVAPDSLTTWEGHTVGFCNPGCRDKFAADPEAYPQATAKFRALAED